MSELPDRSTEPASTWSPAGSSARMRTPACLSQPRHRRRPTQLRRLRGWLYGLGGGGGFPVVFEPVEGVKFDCCDTMVVNEFGEHAARLNRVELVVIFDDDLRLIARSAGITFCCSETEHPPPSMRCRPRRVGYYGAHEGEDGVSVSR